MGYWVKICIEGPPEEPGVYKVLTADSSGRLHPNDGLLGPHFEWEIPEIMWYTVEYWWRET